MMFYVLCRGEEGVQDLSATHEFIRPMITASSFPARASAVWIVFVAYVAIVPSLHSQESPRELHAKAQSLLAQGNYVDAIPVLEMLIQYLGESRVASHVAMMEMIYFNLAVSHFFVGQFEQAEKAFETYLKKYRTGAKVRDAAVFIGDALRFRGKLKEAVTAYRQALRRYPYSKSEKADIYMSIARCYLAEDRWSDAIDPLSRVYMLAGDFLRRNWAATLLTTAYFKEGKVEKVYALVPYLLRPDSFASRSVAFNLAALEAADDLFAEERYRDALWVYRLVYPYDQVLVRSQQHLEWLQRQAELIKRTPGTDPRRLMRIQENIGETEEEIKALQAMDNYDLPLYSRIARGYMEALRYWEAREIFLYLHSGANADAQTAELSLFLAFRCSMQILPWDRAYEIGRTYMEKYPAGEYYDALTLAMGQMYAKEENWPAVIEHLTHVLNVRPGHESAAECMFLVGYACFMEERFPDTLDWLGRLVGRFPESDWVAPATYWMGMAHLFQAHYTEAGEFFQRILQNFPNCPYVEDSAFRYAVCLYGENRFVEADERLKAFLAAYPSSKLAAEATLMRGDIAGAVGRLEEAVVLYQQAMESPDLNIEFYNHCAFQAGRILYEAERYRALRDHFERYIAKARDGSNLPQAIYWIGLALWNEGEQAGALQYYREAVQTYGRERQAVGIDMILDEWVGRAKRTSAEAAAAAWRDLRTALAEAQASSNRVLELRLKRVLLYDPDLKPSEKQTILNEFASAATLPHASAAVLQRMLDLAQERGARDFAAQVAQETIRAFPETDYALDARMMLAEDAIRRLREAAAEAEKKPLYEEAIRHLDVVREVYAASPEAGRALLLLGQLYFEQGRYAQADECYKSILGVKDWRNLWPEALYGRGECAFLQRQYEMAAAYYERIYVMYSHYATWTARAYLRRAEALKRAFQHQKAREVLQEMLAIPALKDLPETQSARRLLESIGERS